MIFRSRVTLQNKAWKEVQVGILEMIPNNRLLPTLTFKN